MSKELIQKQSSDVKAREIAQVEGQIVLSKRFPRDLVVVSEKVKNACSRLKFAEEAIYSYPRGKTQVEGPSIRTAEMLSQCMGNMEYGIREVENKAGYSVLEAYCWDFESNIRVVKEFTIKHVRFTKERGNVNLTDQRDVYEHIANMGARRVRSCILSLIPQDIEQEAIEQINKTLAGQSEIPLPDRVKKMVAAFKKDCSVIQKQIEERLGKKVDAITEQELIQLRKIYKSLVDGMSKPEDWFEKKQPKSKLEKTVQDDQEKKQAEEEKSIEDFEAENKDALL